MRQGGDPHPVQPRAGEHLQGADRPQYRPDHQRARPPRRPRRGHLPQDQQQGPRPRPPARRLRAQPPLPGQVSHLLLLLRRPRRRWRSGEAGKRRRRPACNSGGDVAFFLQVQRGGAGLVRTPAAGRGRRRRPPLPAQRRARDGVGGAHAGPPRDRRADGGAGAVRVRRPGPRRRLLPRRQARRPVGRRLGADDAVEPTLRGHRRRGIWFSFTLLT